MAALNWVGLDMLAPPLLDVILPGDGADCSKKVAAELVQSALSEFHHIENLDQSLANAGNEDPDRATLALIRGIYEEWARSVDALLDHVAPLEKRHGPLAGADLLRNAHGRARALLQISLDRLLRDHETAKRPGVPVQKVRRELRLGIH